MAFYRKRRSENERRHLITLIVLVAILLAIGVIAGIVARIAQQFVRNPLYLKPGFFCLFLGMALAIQVGVDLSRKSDPVSDWTVLAVVAAIASVILGLRYLSRAYR